MQHGTPRRRTQTAIHLRLVRSDDAPPPPESRPVPSDPHRNSALFAMLVVWMLAVARLLVAVVGHEPAGRDLVLAVCFTVGSSVSLALIRSSSVRENDARAVRRAEFQPARASSTIRH